MSPSLGGARAARRRIRELEGRWKIGITASIITVMALIAFSQFSSFAQAFGGGGCHPNDPSHNITQTVCGDFTTSNWQTPYGVVEDNWGACYTATGYNYAYNEWYSNGTLQATEYDRADMSSSCSTNVAWLLLNVGFHSATFNTWGSGSSTYVVLANYTFNYTLGAGTYCGVAGGDPEGISYIETTVAMYDDTTQSAAGYSVFYNESEVSANVAYCNGAQAPSYSRALVDAWACYVTSSIPSGHTMIPRASIFVSSYSSAPYSSTYSPNHGYAQVQSSGTGNAVQLDSIWVSQGTSCGQWSYEQ